MFAMTNVFLTGRGGQMQGRKIGDIPLPARMADKTQRKAWQNGLPGPNFALLYKPRAEETMARVCQLTGKRPIRGNSVSHSNIKTKRRFLPNLQEKRFFVPELNREIKLKISTSALRNINKKGVYQYIREVEKERGIRII